LKKLLKAAGIKIVRQKKPVKLADGTPSPYCKIALKSEPILDLKEIKNIGEAIPGMIATDSGAHLFSLCLFQQEKGDVVEIGSWQGRSTAFLGYAVRQSENGKLWAIDHFKGNVNKEHYYVVEKEDLSDLKEGFQNNIESVGLTPHVNLLNMPNHEAVEQIDDKSVRFLFIDGDHTKAGIEKDLELFLPKLVDGAIIVFDDFSRAFPGVVETVDKLISTKKPKQVMSYPNTLVMRWNGS